MAWARKRPSGDPPRTEPGGCPVSRCQSTYLGPGRPRAFEVQNVHTLLRFALGGPRRRRQASSSQASRVSGGAWSATRNLPLRASGGAQPCAMHGSAGFAVPCTVVRAAAPNASASVREPPAGALHLQRPCARRAPMWTASPVAPARASCHTAARTPLLGRVCHAPRDGACGAAGSHRQRWGRQIRARSPSTGALRRLQLGREISTSGPAHCAVMWGSARDLQSHHWHHCAGPGARVGGPRRFSTCRVCAWIWTGYAAHRLSA